MDATEKLPSRGFIQNMKNAFTHFSELNMAAGFQDIAKTGGRAIVFGFTFLGSYSALDILNNKKLTWDQKILPVMGNLLGTAASLMAGIAMIAAVAGASILLPPFLFAASCVSVFKNTTTYLEARKERNLLRKEFITSTEFQQYIVKNVPQENQSIILKYAYLPQEIYKKFYDLRNQINDAPITLSEKEKLILALYQDMQNFANGKPAPLSLDDSVLPQNIKILKQDLTLLLQEHQTAKKNLSQLNLKPSTIRQIDAFRITQEKIWCQDLPVSIKENLTQLLKNKKNKKRKIGDLYLRIGNDYLNRHPLEQVAAQNEQLEKILNKGGLAHHNISAIMTYIKEPREIYDTLMTFKDHLKNSPQGNLLESYLNFPTSDTAKEALVYLKNLNDPIITNSDNFKKLNILTNQYEQTSEKYEQLKSQFSPEQNKLIRSIESHHFQGLNQYANGHQRVSTSPHIIIPVKEHDIVTKSSTKIKKGIKEQFNIFKQQTKTNPSLASLVKDDPDVPQNPPSIKKEFKQENEYTFELIAEAEKLAFLEKATPRYMANIFLSLGVATLSLASTFVIPAIASPAAPAGVAAGVVITAVSGTLTAASLANSIDLMRKNFRQQYKVKTTKSDITGAVTPHIDLSHEAELLAKLKDELKDSPKQKQPVSDKKEDTELPLAINLSKVKTSKKNMHFTDSEAGSSDREGEKTGREKKDNLKF